MATRLTMTAGMKSAAQMSPMRKMLLVMQAGRGRVRGARHACAHQVTQRRTQATSKERSCGGTQGRSEGTGSAHTRCATAVGGFATAFQRLCNGLVMALQRLSVFLSASASRALALALSVSRGRRET
eukprot:2889091-Rhodomonas_salina.1